MRDNAPEFPSQLFIQVKCRYTISAVTVMDIVKTHHFAIMNSHINDVTSVSHNFPYLVVAAKSLF